MKREPVESTAIRSIGHDPETGELHVEYASGHVYVYRDVTGEQFADLLAAPSKGKHLNTFHRGGTKISPDEGA